MAEDRLRRRLKLDRRGNVVSASRWRSTTVDYRMWRLPRGAVQTIAVESGPCCLLPVLAELTSSERDAADEPITANESGDFSELMKALGCRSRRQFYSEVTEVTLAAVPGSNVVTVTQMVPAADGRGFVEGPCVAVDTSLPEAAAEQVWRLLLGR